VLNLALVTGVVVVVLLNPTRPSNTVQASAAGTQAGVQNTVAPVDQLTSVAVALTVARMTDLPEAPAVANQADSASIQLAIVSTNNEVVNKPQAVSSAFLSNKQIVQYIVKDGDTASSVAGKFGVSTDSILWSNDLVSSILPAGKMLLIPPTDGIVYTVKAGDTPGSLATRYHASADRIVAFNDAELSGLKVGERIVVPDGKIIAAPVYMSYYAPSGFAWGSGAIYGFNGYDYGNCTWYVATQIAVPANWGNAATWASGARAAGWHVSAVPVVGAIAQTPYAAGGLGHVAIVKAVSADHTQIKFTDMNGLAGFAAVGNSWQIGPYAQNGGWAPASLYPNYITAP